jgi:acyl-CoA reductase-like NAD-dependent aldehyde dehydrogenase
MTPLIERTCTAVTHRIAGVKVEGDSHTIQLDAPDARPLYRVPEAGSTMVEQALEAAVAARRGWRLAPARERAAVLLDAARRLRQGAGPATRTIVLESGKPIRQARGEVERAAGALEDYAHFARSAGGTVEADHSDGVWGMELLEGIGVVAVICTWNLPLQLCALKVGAALAAGCPVVVKTSPFAPQAPEYLISALEEAGLPAGCASILHGDSVATETLVSHPLVDAVSFTGHDRTGRDVMRQAAAGPKKVLLELGGKSANIVFGDAPLERAVAGVAAGVVRNQGATCTAGTRILVERSLYESFTERLCGALGNVRVGDPFEAATEVGAIRHQGLYERIRTALEQACAGGGTLLAGGGWVEVPGRTGHYLQPTLVGDVGNDDPLCRDELFGPVAAVIPFEGTETAIEIANENSYGLAAGIWSADLERLEYVWRRLDVGTVYINSYHRIDGIPLASAGRKRSGFGSEGGKRGMEELMATKSVHMPRLGSVSGS